MQAVKSDSPHLAGRQALQQYGDFGYANDPLSLGQQGKSPEGPTLATPFLVTLLCDVTVNVVC